RPRARWCSTSSWCTSSGCWAPRSSGAPTRARRSAAELVAQAASARAEQAAAASAQAEHARAVGTGAGVVDEALGDGVAQPRGDLAGRGLPRRGEELLERQARGRLEQRARQRIATRGAAL